MYYDIIVMCISYHIMLHFLLLFFWGGGVKPAQIQESSSFISLGLVYPPPQPLISNRP